MKTIKNGRRQFLANIALLSTGVVVAGPASLGLGKAGDADLESKWRSLCEKLQGNNFYGNLIKEPSYYLKPCAGHNYAMGKPVSFINNTILAVPVWISWQNSNKPADMVVSFFKSDGLSKLCTLNRYELEALSLLELGEGGEKSLLQLLDKNKINKSLIVTISNTGLGRSSVQTKGSLCGKYIQQNQLFNI